jgi:hypothetical protein
VRIELIDLHNLPESTTPAGTATSPLTRARHASFCPSCNQKRVRHSGEQAGENVLDGVAGGFATSPCGFRAVHPPLTFMARQLHHRPRHRGFAHATEGPYFALSRIGDNVTMAPRPS